MSSDTRADASAAAPSKAAAGIEVTGSSVACEVTDVDTVSIQFNNKAFETWANALAAARKLVDKCKDDSSKNWYRTDIVLEEDGSFSLHCSSCEMWRTVGTALPQCCQQTIWPQQSPWLYGSEVTKQPHNFLACSPWDTQKTCTPLWQAWRQSD